MKHSCSRVTQDILPGGRYPKYRSRLLLDPLYSPFAEVWPGPCQGSIANPNPCQPHEFFFSFGQRGSKVIKPCAISLQLISHLVFCWFQIIGRNQTGFASSNLTHSAAPRPLSYQISARVSNISHTTAISGQRRIVLLFSSFGASLWSLKTR